MKNKILKNQNRNYIKDLQISHSYPFNFFTRKSYAKTIIISFIIIHKLQREAAPWRRCNNRIRTLKIEVKFVFICENFAAIWKNTVHHSSTLVRACREPEMRRRVHSVACIQCHIVTTSRCSAVLESQISVINMGLCIIWMIFFEKTIKINFSYLIKILFSSFLNCTQCENGTNEYDWIEKLTKQLS